MFYLICVWINGWVNNREAGDLRRHRGHYDVNVMKLAMNPTIFSMVIFFRNDLNNLLPQIFVIYENSNDISEMFEESMDKSDLVRVACFMGTVMSKFKYESTHPNENVPKKQKTIKYTRSGRAIRPPTKLTLWFPYIATIYTYCLSLSLCNAIILCCRKV